VFDEIDTGISGTMGHKIAEKMKSVSKFHQVIVVTHLAQIASITNHHYLIQKQEQNNKTTSSVKKLSVDESKSELTRMVGGQEFLTTLKG
jgi:DNA repair protein RecN (Recombination protein N)